MQYMKKYNRIFPGFLVLLLLMLPCSLVADDIDYTRNGKFLYYGIGARALSMGGAYTGLGGDILSMYYNPAGLSRIDRQYNGYAMLSRLYGASDYSFIGVAFPRINLCNKNRFLKPLIGDDATWGVGFVNLVSGDFQERDEYDNFWGDFGFSQKAMLLSWAGETMLFKNYGILSFGATQKIILQDFGDYPTTSTVGYDLGLQLQLLNPPILKDFISLRRLIPLRIGFVWQNINTPQLRSVDDREELPSVRKLGFSYNPYLINGHSWIAALDFEQVGIKEEKIRINMGLEYNLNFKGSIVSPRLGYRGRSGKLTFGLGLNFDIEGYDFFFNYAFKNETIVGGEHRISLAVRFGNPRKIRYFWNEGSEFYEKRNEAGEDKFFCEDKSKNYLLQIISRFPMEIDSDDIYYLYDSSLEQLGDVLDVVNKKRYDDLLRGLGKARKETEEWLQLGKSYRSTKQDLLSKFIRNDSVEAERLITYWHEGLKRTPDRFTDDDFMNYATLLLIIKDVDSALSILNHISDKEKIRLNYLYGIVYLFKKNADMAETYFRSAVQNQEIDNMTMYLLSAYELAKILIENKSDTAAEDTLKIIIGRKYTFLTKYRSWFGNYADTSLGHDSACLADDALYEAGLCCERLKDKSGIDEETKKTYINQALIYFEMVSRYYPDLDKCGDAREKVKNLLK